MLSTVEGVTGCTTGSSKIITLFYIYFPEKAINQAKKYINDT